jgi:hypothetical protein
MFPDNSFQNVEGVILATLFVALVLMALLLRFRRSRPLLVVGWPIAVAFGLRLLAIAGINATGLETTLRGGDETTFLALARVLASQPLGHGDFPHGPYQLHVVLLALEMKLGFLNIGALRIVQVGLALVGIFLIIVSIYDLAGPRAARLAAWLFAFEPTSIFFNSEIHKDPMMELAAGLVVFGGTWLWRRLDVRGIFICALGGFIGVETRSYAGWFLVCAAVLVLLHAAIRNMNRPMRAMPIIYGVIVAAFLIAPTVLAATSNKQLQLLQQSQNANAQGIGEGSGTANSSNLALEQVNFSTRGAVISHLPIRIRELVLQPYPWQLQDSSQRFGAIGTLVAYALLLLLTRYAWLSRGEVLARAAPLIYPLFFLLVAYSLAVGNAGTGFRYRSHLVTLAIGVVVVLRARLEEAPAVSKMRAWSPRWASRRLGPTPSATHDMSLTSR